MPLMKFHLASAVSFWLRRLTNVSNAGLLRQIKDAEVCPYVEVIPIFSQRVARLAAHIAKNGGVAFTDGNHQKYFWHPNERFVPITATAIFQKDAGWKPSPPTGELCRLCRRCEKARPKYRDI
jgi:hypothetical protein